LLSPDGGLTTPTTPAVKIYLRFWIAGKAVSKGEDSEKLSFHLTITWALFIYLSVFTKLKKI
jgi:hypothetical protein